MKIRIGIISLVLLGSLGLAGAALAKGEFANHTQKSDKCLTLEHEFDAASKGHVPASKLEQAREQRTHGAELCAQGKHEQGIRALERALKEIGGR